MDSNNEQKPKARLGGIPILSRLRAASSADKAVESVNQLILDAAKKSAELEAACARAAEVQIAVSEARLRVERLAPEHAGPLLEQLVDAEARMVKQLGDVCPIPAIVRKGR